MASIDDGAGAGYKAGVNANKQLLVTDSTRARTGIYAASSGLISVAPAAQTASTGHMFLHNPPNSTRVIAVRRVELHSMGVAVSAAVTRVVMVRCTSTGTFTGAEITPAKVDTTAPVNSGKASLVSTGLVLTPGATMFGFLMMSVITAAGAAVPSLLEYEPKEEGMLVLRAGESLMMQQPDAGVATDPRRVVVNFAWEEF